MRSSPDNRRGRLGNAGLVMALMLVIVGVLLTPGLRWPEPGATPDQVALQRTEAQVKDLKRQLDEANTKLRRRRPLEPDLIALARADDLAQQLDEANAKLAEPDPDDPALVAAATRPRPPIPDYAALARAADLAAQNDRLVADAMRPRPIPDPLANVTATATKAEIVASRNLFGLYTTQSPFNYGEVDLVQSQVARKANTVGYFQSWRDPFDAYPIRNAWSRGQVPLLTWEPQAQVGDIVADQPEFRLSRIYGGAFDDYIRSYARGIRDNGLPVVIRLAHEQNGNWYSWSEWSDARGVSVNGNQQGDYVKMWRHVHDIFRQEGANDQAIWLWSPNRVNRICGQRRPAAFWPGEQYVDWIGTSGYYRNYDRPGGACDDIGASFDAVFGNTLTELRAIPGNKPILLSEIGATERGGDKARWINDLFRGLKANTDIIGFAWFSLAVTAGGENDRFTHDWRINSSPESITAMRDGLASSGFGRPAT